MTIQRAAPVILLFLLAVAFLYPAVLGGQALLPAEYLDYMRPWSGGEVEDDQSQPQWNPLLWDGIAQFYPWRVHYSRSMSDGFIPLWNPHQFCGTPFAANAQTAVFYPLNLIFVITSPVRAFGYSALLHLFLAGAFSFLLSRTLGLGRFGAMVAGVTFPFSAFMVAWLELPSLINVATWLPLVLYLILRSSDRSGIVHSIFAGVALGMSVLAGHFQIASYVFTAAALWWIWLTIARARVHGREELMRGMWLALASFGVAFLVAAPQILPTVELAGLSHRVREVSAEGYAGYISNAIPARNLITLFVPNYYGNPSVNTYWFGSAANFIEFAMYIGLMPLLLAITGAVFTVRWRGAGFFLMLALLGLFLALGTPLNLINYFLIPGTSALGGPNRTIVLFCFAAAMLAGYGAHWFVQMAQEDYHASGRKLGWRALGITGAIFAAFLVIAQSITSASLERLGVDPASASSVAIPQYISFGAILLASLGILALYAAKQIPKPLFAALALVVTVADLFSFGAGLNPTSPVEKVYPETELTRRLSENVGSDRLMPINPYWSLSRLPDAVLPPNAATVYGLYDMQGYDSLFPRIYKQFVDGRLNMDSSPPENGNMLLIRRYQRLWPQGTAGYILSIDPIEAPALNQVFEADGVRVYRQSTYGPYLRTYLLPPTEEQVAFPVQKPNFRSWVAEQSPNEVTVYVETDQISRVLLADTYYPGWRAYVEGERRQVELSQEVFRSVLVEPGAQSVIFRFEPGSVIVGMFLGLLGVMVTGVGVGMALERRRRR